MKKLLLIIFMLTLSVNCFAKDLDGGGAGATSENIAENLPDKVVTNNYYLPFTSNDGITFGDSDVTQDGKVRYTTGGDLVVDTPTGLKSLTAGSSGGEANTASDVGSGVGVVKGKAGIDLEHYSLLASENVSITLNGDNIEISSIDTNDHDDLANTGNNTHYVIDEHLASTNIHNTILAGDNIYINKDGLSVTVSVTPTPQFDYVDLTTGNVAPSHNEGRLFYDDDNKTLGFYNDESDSTLQIGQEVWLRAVNTTGVTINNGQVVYISGTSNGLPTLGLAKADSANTALSTIALATHEIEPGTVGLSTRIGTVRGVDTSACNAGDRLYLSADVAGAFTTVNPTSPDWSVFIGTCTNDGVTTGTIEVQVNAGNNTRDVIKIFNGGILEDHNIDVTSNGAEVALCLEQNGGGDLSLFFDGLFTFFDSTPAVSVNLTVGTDSSPVLNYVYIDKATVALTSNITGFPTDEQFVPIATCVIQSASDVQANGAYKAHAWTDHLSDAVDQGHISHVNEWIRNQQATWLSGVVLATDPGETVSSGDINISSSSGTILQLHKHNFPALNTAAGDDLHIVNYPADSYKKAANINTTDFDVDSAGGSLNNRYYTIVLWGVVSEDPTDCHYFVNLPSGTYATLAGAIDDALGFNNFNIGRDFVGTGFLISSLIIRNSGGTVTIQDGGIVDLRGQIPGVGAASGGVAATTFSDGQFRVFDNADDTKNLAFEVSNVTAGQTRTITMPDRDIDLDNVTQIASTGNGETLVDGSEPGVQYIKSLEAGTNVTFVTSDTKIVISATGGGGGGITAGNLVSLNHIVANNDSSIEFTANIDDTYDIYQIEFCDIQSSRLSMQMSTNNGSTYFTGATDYTYAYTFDAAARGSDGTTSIRLTEDLNSGSPTRNAVGEIRLYHLRSSIRPSMIKTNIGQIEDDGLGMTSIDGTGALYDLSPVNAIKIIPSAGNIVSGNFVLYGVAK